MKRSNTLLAVASSGGHWEQLMLLRPALRDFRVVFATTNASLGESFGLSDVEVIPNCHRNAPMTAFACAGRLLKLIFKERPALIVSTGAAPGLVAIAVGRLTGTRTLWIDSIANSERLSLSGRVAQRIAHACLTQWQHLARPNGPRFLGSVL